MSQIDLGIYVCCILAIFAPSLRRVLADMRDTERHQNFHKRNCGDYDILVNTSPQSGANIEDIKRIVTIMQQEHDQNVVAQN